jgi:fumarate reductase flavoprotein subunit
VVRAATLPELAPRLAGHGVDPAGLTETVADYNAAIADGTADRLAIPRTGSRHPITTSPLLAIKVAVGVSMTYGGVAIDTSARALDAAGVPVPGLYAVPGTAGGIHHLHYAGALAACGVFGMIAADTVAADLAISG